MKKVRHDQILDIYGSSGFIMVSYGSLTGLVPGIQKQKAAGFFFFTFSNKEFIFIVKCQYDTTQQISGSLKTGGKLFISIPPN